MPSHELTFPRIRMGDHPLEVLAVLALFLAATSCGQGGKGTPDTGDSSGTPRTVKAVAVEVAEVRRESLSSLYATSSHFRAEREATIIARTEGLLSELRFEEGDLVNLDDTVAILDDSEPLVETERAKKILEIKQRSFDRSEILEGDGMVSENDFDNSLRELVEAKHAAEMAQLRLAYTKVKAPFEGRILRRHLDVGASVSNGTAIYDIADLNPLYADVRVPERHVSRLKVEQDVRLSMIDSGEIQASIERIGPEVDPANGTVKVTLAVANPNAAYRPGSFIKVAIVTDTHPQAMVVQRSALVAEGHHWHVFRVDEIDRVAKKVEVSLGFEEGDRVEIASVIGNGELHLGDRVVVLGASALTEGAPIEWVEDAESASMEEGEVAGSESAKAKGSGDAIGPS